MWETVEVIYKVCTFLMAGICLLAFVVNRQTIDLLAASFVIFAFTVMSMFIVDSYPAPWHSSHMVVQDVACTWVAWWAAGRTSERWPHWLKIIFATQCGIHVLYWGALFVSRTFFGGALDGFLTSAYPWPINTLFVIMVLVVSAAGGGHVARYVRDRLRRLLHSHSAFGAGGA